MRLFAKRSLAVLLSVLMLLSVMMVGTVSGFAAEESKLYLVPNANWNKDGARFAAYFFNAGETWVSMTAVEGQDNLYEVTVPEGGYPNVIFCRMNPNTTENIWNNKWNQTSDLDIPTDGTNCYTVAENTWDKGDGTWGTYTPGEELTTAPTTAPAPKTYTVVGAITPEHVDGGCFGKAWEPSATANDMTDEDGDGVYTKVYSDVAANSYEFKVVANHSWGETYGDENGANIAFTVEASATVTISFDTASNKVSYTIEGNTVPSESESQETTPSESQETTPSESQETTPAEPKTVYFVNSGEWEEVYAHLWADGITTQWPGVATEKTDLKDVNGYDVYSVTFTEPYTNVIFNNNDNGLQTSNEASAIQDGQVLNGFDQKWYETVDDVPVAVKAYTLCGYINGADVGAGVDKDTVVPEYNFVDGTVTVTFESEKNYVMVKTTNNAKFYGAKEYTTGTSADLYEIGTEKLLVPAGTIKFTLVEQASGRLTLSYEVVEPASSETESSSSETPSESTAPNDGYTLVGYINGEDIGIGNNASGLNSAYNFIDGTVTVELTEISYVCIKTTNNRYTYMTDGQPEEGATSATLYEELTLDGRGNKLTVPAGEVEFTLVKNSDGTLTLSYEVIKLAPTTEPTSTEPPVVSLMGTMSDWETGTVMTGVDGIYTTTVELAQGTYEFKIKINDTWFSNTGEIVDTTLTTSEIGWEMVVTEGIGNNCRLKATGGTYTFQFNTATNMLIVLAEVVIQPTTAPGPKEYTLVGYINGADVGCESDFTNIVPEYTFKDGKVTVTFEAENNYVFIKTTTTPTEWFMTDVLCEDTTALLKPVATGADDKMLVPGGVELTFTLVENEDGTLSLSYVTGEKPSESESSSSESESTTPSESSSSSESESTTPSESSSSSETPSESAEPSESTNPSSSETPSESTEPSESTNPSSSETPSESTEPSESTAPSSSETPSESTEPTESTAPTTAKPVPKKPAFKYAKKTLSVGSKYTLKVVNAGGNKVTNWSSTKTKVAIVSSKGIVTALGKGSTTITAKVGGTKIKCTITVNSSPKIYNGKKAVTNKTITVKKGKTLTLTIKGKAASVNNSYKTSNKKIAKVVSGKSATKVKIKAYKKGNAKVTITVNKYYKKTVKIKVV